MIGQMEELLQQLSPPLSDLVRIIITAAIGLLIGLEREQALFAREEELFAGVRTYPLITLFGYLAAMVAANTHPLIFALGFVGFLLFVTVSYYLLAQRGEIGATTEISIFIAFLLGALVYFHYTLIAIAAAVLITLILSLKLQFQTLIQKLSREDIYATLKFIVITVLILPLLPKQPIDPYDALSLRNLWYMVILVSSLSFIGYILLRFGKAQRDILLLGFIGGIASSTATSWEFAQRSRELPELTVQYAAGIILACYVMFIRILLLVLVVSPPLAQQLVPPTLVVCLAGGGISYFLLASRLRTQKIMPQPLMKLKNPFHLGSALTFGVIYGTVSLIVTILQKQVGLEAVYLFSGISGFAETDAVAISLAKLSPHSFPLPEARNAVFLALLTNSITKYAITLLRGSRTLFRYTSMGFIPMLLIGFLYLLLAP